VPTNRQPFSAEDRQELAAIFATNNEILAPFYSRQLPEQSRYPIDLTQGFDTLLTHLTPVRTATRILVVRGLFQCQSGELDQGVESFLAAGRLTRSLSEEPLLISQLVECANWAIICRRLESALNTASLNSEQLSALQEMLVDAETNSFYRGLAGEQASGCAVFSNPRMQARILGPNEAADNSARLKAQVAIAVLKSSGFFKGDKAFYLQTMSNFIGVARLPFPERIKASQNLSVIPPRKFYVFSSMLLPALGKSFTRDATRCANIRVTETALAIERFRRSNSNSLPADLSELVPAFLSAIPTDPFDGKPLRFKRRAQGYVVYSIGSDLQDDGGAERDPKKTGVRSDVTFILDK
jgi:hypothetical protein